MKYESKIIECKSVISLTVDTNASEGTIYVEIYLLRKRLGFDIDSKDIDFPISMLLYNGVLGLVLNIKFHKIDNDNDKLILKVS